MGMSPSSEFIKWQQAETSGAEAIVMQGNNKTCLLGFCTVVLWQITISGYHLPIHLNPLPFSACNRSSPLTSLAMNPLYAKGSKASDPMLWNKTRFVSNQWLISEFTQNEKCTSKDMQWNGSNYQNKTQRMQYAMYEYVHNKILTDKLIFSAYYF